MHMNRRSGYERDRNGRKNLPPRIAAILLAVGVAAILSPNPESQSLETQAIVPPEFAGALPQELKDQVAQYGGGAMLIAAKALGIAEIASKDISQSGEAGPPGNAKAPKLKDVPIAAHPTKHENEPTVVANPVTYKNLVAGSHFFGPPPPTANRCIAFNSFDRGQTWNGPIVMPQLTPASQCSDPVLAFAPDGSRVYYAYMDIKITFTPPSTLAQDFDIVMSYSDDGGVTWVGPIMVLDGTTGVILLNPPPAPPTIVTPGFQYDKPWIGTHVSSNSNDDEQHGPFVYVTATRFPFFNPALPPNAIVFTRSTAQGGAGTWEPPKELDSGLAAAPFTLVQGSRPTGGPNGEVLVAWFHSGNDGWLQGSFKIRVRRSGDFGATFGPVVDAVNDASEAPFFLGPFCFYHRWWPTMMPDVEIDPGGEAHVMYTHDPAGQPAPGCANPSTEDGDIRYISSVGPPYDSWSAPITVNDDGTSRAQGYGALETQHGGNAGQLHTLHAIWEDHRLSPNLPIIPPVFPPPPAPPTPPSSPNQFYDMFYSRKTPGLGVGWFRNFRVSDVSSVSDFVFLGDYYDITTNPTLIFGIWTDRRDQATPFQFEDDVFGGLIIPGGAVPKQ